MAQVYADIGHREEALMFARSARDVFARDLKHEHPDLLMVEDMHARSFVSTKLPVRCFRQRAAILPDMNSS